MRRAVALLGLLICLAPALRVGAQEGGGATRSRESAFTPSSDFETAVRREIGARWRVAPERITLAWGGYRGAAGDLTVRPELLGSGSAGYWVVRFPLADGKGRGSVRLRAGVRTREPVAARTLGRGDEVDAEAIAEREVVVWGAPRRHRSFVTPGWIAQRVVRKGEVLRAPAVQPPMAVVSGHPVELLWKRGGVGLRLPGRAVSSAALGEEVFVRTAAGERLRGIAVAPGIVNVTRGGGQ